MTLRPHEPALRSAKPTQRSSADSAHGGRLSGIIAQADVATRVHRDDATGQLVEAISESSTARK